MKRDARQKCSLIFRKRLHLFSCLTVRISLGLHGSAKCRIVDYDHEEVKVKILNFKLSNF